MIIKFILKRNNNNNKYFELNPTYIRTVVRQVVQIRQVKISISWQKTDKEVTREEGSVWTSIPRKIAACHLSL